jgi:hypothetical protein
LAATARSTASATPGSPKNTAHPASLRNLTPGFKPGTSGNPLGRKPLNGGTENQLRLLHAGLAAMSEMMAPGKQYRLTKGNNSRHTVTIVKDHAGVMHYLVDGAPGLPDEYMPEAGEGRYEGMVKPKPGGPMPECIVHLSESRRRIPE